MGSKLEISGEVCRRPQNELFRNDVKPFSLFHQPDHKTNGNRSVGMQNVGEDLSVLN